MVSENGRGVEVRRRLLGIFEWEREQCGVGMGFLVACGGEEGVYRGDEKPIDGDSDGSRFGAG
jgi:hypothetical protein